MRKFKTYQQLVVYSLMSLVFYLSSNISYSQTPIPAHAGSLASGGGDVLAPVSVFVLGNYAYMGQPGSLEIADISDPSSPIHVGNIKDGEGGAYLSNPTSVFVSGNYAYVTDRGSYAMEIIDVSNPASPVHAASLVHESDSEGGVMKGAISIFVSGNYAYITTFYTLTIVDISNPLMPYYKGSISNNEALLNGAYSVYVDGNYAYVTSAYNDDALVIIDVTNPAKPTLAGTIRHGEGGALLEDPNSVYVSGNYAYVASKTSGALEIVDVSNPAIPIHAASVTNGEGGASLVNPISVHVSGSYVYVANHQSLEVIDISDPAAPVHAGRISDGTGGALLDGASTVFVKGNYAYVASSTSQALEILDISTSTSPVHEGSLTTENGVLLNAPESVYISGNYAYVAGTSGVTTIDITDPAVPVQLGSIMYSEGSLFSSYSESIFVSGNYAYVTIEYTDVLEIIDISNPTVPVHSGSIINGAGGALLNSPQSVFVLGNYAYVVGSSYLEIVDVSDPSAPVHKGSISNGSGGALLSGPRSVYVVGNYAYVAVIGSDALEVIDISDPAAPTHAGSIINGAGGALLDGANSVFVLGDYAYVTSAGTAGGLEVIDIGDPTAPVHAGSVSNGTGATSVFVDGNYAYVLASDALEIIDISNPASPTYSTSIADGEGGALLDSPESVFVDGNFAYVTSYWDNALEVVSLFSPASPIANAATSVTQTSFTASCSQIANASTGYFLDVSTDNFTTFVSSYNDASVGYSASVTGLTANTNYQYRFRVANTNGVSNNSNVVNVITRQTTPTALSATDVTETSFTANWELVDGATVYYVDVTTDAGFSWVWSEYNNVSTLTNSLTIDNLSAGYTYYYRVRTQNSAGASASSNTITVATALGTPVAKEATSIGTTSFVANWQTLNGAELYYLEVSTNSDLSLPVAGYDGSVAIHSSILNYSVSGLASGTTYYYRITAENSAGRSPASGIITLLTYPAAPVAINASNVTQTSFDVNWNLTSGVDSYYLEVSTVNDFSVHLGGFNGTAAMAGGNTSQTVLWLSPGVEYFYRVTAENATGKSASSNIINQFTIPANPFAHDVTSLDIDATSFKAKWNVVSGAIDYELEVSSDGFNSLITGYDPNTLPGTQGEDVVSGLTAATTYEFRLRARNSAGVSSNSNIISVTTTAGSSSFALASINYTSTGNSQTLNISVSGGSPPYTVNFKHRGLLNSTFTEVTLNADTPGNYSFDITPGLLDNIGVEFIVEVSDTQANSDSESGKIYASFSEAASPDLTFEKYGGGSNDWNLFSIPYDLDNKAVSTMFAEYPSDRHLFDWKLVRYSNSGNSYLPFNTGQVKLGEAYWFNGKERKPVNMGAGKVSTQIPFNLSLLRGWNLIGNPFPVNISWNQVLANNPAVTEAGRLQVFNGVQQVAGDIIKPFGGGFVFASAATEIIIDPAASQSGGRLAGSPGKIENEDIDWKEWQLDFSLVSDGKVEVRGGIGMHPEALLLNDQFDAMAVPRFFTYTDMFTEHEDYFYPWFNKDVVPTKTSYTWALSVETNKVHGSTELEWNQTAIRDAKSSLFLLDKQSGQLIDMKAQSSHPITLTDGIFDFEVYYTSGEDPLLPNNLILGTAYPNPARTYAIIPVILPDGMDDKMMNLSVYDINGKLMATLANDVFAPGFYEFKWDVGDSKQQMHNGMFIYQITFSDGSIPPIQKKLVVR